MLAKPSTVSRIAVGKPTYLDKLGCLSWIPHRDLEASALSIRRVRSAIRQELGSIEATKHCGVVRSGLLKEQTMEVTTPSYRQDMVMRYEGS